MATTAHIAVIAAFSFLFTTSMAHGASVITPLPAPISKPFCLFNSTHCSCRNVDSPGTCLRDLGHGECLTAQCSSTGFTCDCTGTTVCKISKCKAWVSSAGVPTSSIGLGTIVRCQLGEVQGCLTHVDEKAVASPEPEEPEYRMVQFGKGVPSTMFNMSAFADEDGLIEKTYNMHGKWKNAQRLRQRFITLRLYERAQGGMMLCAIYNTYGVEDDQLGNMGVDVLVTGLSGQRLQWVVCDDAGECKPGSSIGLGKNSLYGKHKLVSYLSDGWCVKPLESNGNVVSVKLTNINGMRGVVLQSTAGRDTEYLFADGKDNGMTGIVNENGLVGGGTVPEIQFNLLGFKVPF